MANSTFLTPQSRWFTAAIACHEADISYLAASPKKSLPVPESTSSLSKIIANFLSEMALDLFSQNLFSFVARHVSSRGCRLAIGYLILDVGKLWRELVGPYVGRFDLFDEMLVGTSLGQHQECLFYAQKKLENLSDGSVELSLELLLNDPGQLLNLQLNDPDKLDEVLKNSRKKEYPGVSIEWLPAEDTLTGTNEERTHLQCRQLARLNLFVVEEEIRAAKTEELLNALDGRFETPISKMKVVAGAIAILAFTLFPIVAGLYIQYPLSILPAFLRAPGWVGATFLVNQVYASVVKGIRTETGLDKLMQFNECEKEIESHLAQIKKWKERFQSYENQTKFSILQPSITLQHQKAHNTCIELEARQTAFYQAKAKLGFLSSFLFTASPASSLLYEGCKRLSLS